MNKLYQVVAIGALVRFVLPTVVPSVVDNLAASNLVSSPILSYLALKEAFYYLDFNMDLYDGGVNHHPPLLVILLLLVNHPVALNFIYTVVDVIITFRLVAINRWYDAYSKKRTVISASPFSDSMIAAFYLFNPLLVLTNISKSTLIFTNFFVVETIHQIVVSRNWKRAMVALGVATYLSLTPAVFLLVLLLALGKSVLSLDNATLVRATALYVAVVAFLITVSVVMLHGSTNFISLCYGTVLLHAQITPNMGLWWYIFTEMFDFFRPFYVGLFNVYTLLFIVPFTLRFLEVAPNAGDSFLAVVITYFWLSFTKSYPSLGDLGFGLAFLPIFRNTVLPHCKYAYLAGVVLLVCLVLAPIFYYSWIVLGSGNSNFFYSITLSWGVAHIIIIMDLIWGKLTFDYVEQHKVDKSVRLTQA